jgi:hypothetical protein
MLECGRELFVYATSFATEWLDAGLDVFSWLFIRDEMNFFKKGFV